MEGRRAHHIFELVAQHCVEVEREPLQLQPSQMAQRRTRSSMAQCRWPSAALAAKDHRRIQLGLIVAVCRADGMALPARTRCTGTCGTAAPWPRSSAQPTL